MLTLPWKQTVVSEWISRISLKNVDVLFIVINPLEVRCLESSQPSFIENIQLRNVKFLPMK